MLGRDGRFEIQTAATGYDAGVMTESFKPDLMLLDFMLPDINGNVVCRTIRESEKHTDMKIIIVSGVVKQEDIDQLLGAGADDFVKKPFNIDKLMSKIGELLEV